MKSRSSFSEDYFFRQVFSMMQSDKLMDLFVLTWLFFLVEQTFKVQGNFIVNFEICVSHAED